MTFGSFLREKEKILWNRKFFQLPAAITDCKAVTIESRGVGTAAVRKSLDS